jgi:cation transporter-like permease
MERLELIVLLISVVISVIVGDYLYSVTHNVLANVVTILILTPVLYYGVKWLARAAGYPLREY